MLPFALAASPVEIGSPLALSHGAPSPFQTGRSEPTLGVGGSASGTVGHGSPDGTIGNQASPDFVTGDSAHRAPQSGLFAPKLDWAPPERTATEMKGPGGDGPGDIDSFGGLGGQGDSGFALFASTGNGAGNGGDGFFTGGLVQTSLAVYDPINIAVAGSHAQALADQDNMVQVHQGAVQMGGVGGDGGNGNVTSSALPSESAGFLTIPGIGGTGGAYAGNGGDGYFSGALVHSSFAIYHPVNIAIAAYKSHAEATQTNDVIIDQHALQVAGIGGHGGNGNAAFGGFDADASFLRLIGSDAVALAGGGGDGHFSGAMVDVDIAIYAPINIAVAGYHSVAEAHQSNALLLDQTSTQLAGIGGDGGDGNHAGDVDLLFDFLAAAHLLS